MLDESRKTEIPAMPESQLFARLLLILLCLALPARAATQDSAPDPEFPATIVELTIASDGKRLPALAYLANGPGPHPTVLILHGFPGNERNLDIAQALRRDGFNTLFFNYRGAWGAEGEFRLLNLAPDVAAVLAFLRVPDNAGRLRVDTDKLSLLGHSMGGFAALAAGSRDPQLACVGAIAPANVGQIKLGVDTEDANSLRILKYADSLFMLNGYSSAVMLEELRAAKLSAVDTRAFGPGLSGKSVFLVGGDQDPVTPAQTMLLPMAEEYAKQPGLKLEQHVISGDHSFSWSRLALTALIQEWMQRDCT